MGGHSSLGSSPTNLCNICNNDSYLQMALPSLTARPYVFSESVPVQGRRERSHHALPSPRRRITHTFFFFARLLSIPAWRRFVRGHDRASGAALTLLYHARRRCTRSGVVGGVVWSWRELCPERRLSLRRDVDVAMWHLLEGRGHNINVTCSSSNIRRIELIR